jgi:glycosyltransferase involved in cell wall biosynthesis
LTGHPKKNLSVILPVVNPCSPIEECVESLRRSCPEAEVIVANRCGRRKGILLKEKYPWVKLIEASPHMTIPQLRGLAFLLCSGDVIAVIEDHCIVEPGWARAVMDAHDQGYPVIGGSVENAACERLVDWAAFFCEYSQAMKPILEGEVDAVPGNNVSYKRWVLEKFYQQLEAGEWDFVLHEHMRAAGIPLYSVPSITVYHKMSGSLKWVLLQKFHFARSFAGRRFIKAKRLQRAAYGMGALLLPFLLLGRIFPCVWNKRKHRCELLLSLPFLNMLLLSWGAGEAVGYLFGAGSSPTKVC